MLIGDGTGTPWGFNRKTLFFLIYFRPHVFMLRRSFSPSEEDIVVLDPRGRANHIDSPRVRHNLARRQHHHQLHTAANRLIMGSCFRKISRKGGRQAKKSNICSHARTRVCARTHKYTPLQTPPWIMYNNRTYVRPIRNK